MWNYKTQNDKEDRLKTQVEKNGIDIIYTNPQMATDLINTIFFLDGDIVLDPCRGQGAFYDNLPPNVVKQYCEINEGIDYLKWEGKVDITLSNPPFVPRQLFWDFHKKAMETTTKNIYWLVSMTCLNSFTPKRLSEMEKLGWYIETPIYVVNDKRWYGRYIWLKFGRNPHNKIFIPINKKYV